MSGSAAATVVANTGANAGDIQISSDGIPVGGLQRGPGDTRAFQTVNVHDDATGDNNTKLVVVDLGTATVTGDVLNIDGASYSAGGVRFSADGTTAFVTTTTGGPDLDSIVTTVTGLPVALTALMYCSVAE